MAKHFALQQRFSNPCSWHLGVLPLFYPITLLNEAHCIRSAFWCLISPLIRWQKWRPRTYWNPHSSLPSLSTVVPRCIQYMYSGPHETRWAPLVPEVCCSLFGCRAQNRSLHLFSKIVLEGLYRVCAPGSVWLKLPVVMLFHSGLLF